jgi:ribose 5-phosphate isomerase B
MNTKMIYIGSDHAGFTLKEKVISYLKSAGYEVDDSGTYSEDSVDYPDFAHPVAEKTAAGNESKGILICGSGNGVCMTANKHKGVRAALCWNTDLARLAREHNNANILCLSARFISDEEALDMVNVFLNTPFERGRHTRRVEKI